MKIIFSIILIVSFYSTPAQSHDPRTEFLNQLSEELVSKFSSHNKKAIVIDEKIKWDDNAATFRTYLCKFDTSNHNSIEMKARGMRDRILRTLAMFNDDDYSTFKRQAMAQYDTTFLTTSSKQTRRLKRDTHVISFSQPLISADKKKIACLYLVRSGDGSFTSAGNIYCKNDFGVWIECVNLYQEKLSY